MSKPLKQIHLAAHFPGVNNTTVWSDPRAGSHIEFSSFAHFARTAERATFDFLFLAEGLRLREQGGKIYDLDVVGRPDTFTVLAALAAVTEHLGLTGTINSTFNEPYEVARQFATLDHLSGGRSAWNVVTSWDAFTGENFRRGGFLPQDERYTRAEEFLATAGELFDSWRGDEIVADPGTGVFLNDAKAGSFVHTGHHFDIQGQFDVPRSPQGRPVVFQAGDSEEGREFAASSADAIFSRYATLKEGQDFYADVKRRLAAYGRTPDQLKILPAATFVLGDTDAEAEELARDVRRRQVSGATAIKHLEFVWNRDLSGYDPDGPLPDVDPDVRDRHIAEGRAQVRMYRDPLATAREWRERAAANGWSIRDLVINTGNRQSFVGSPATVARTLNDLVQADAADGFILVPHLTPGGLDAFADQVVPLLRERGVFRTAYEGPTLRHHLGLAHPDDVRDARAAS
ncbi:NtaA/DmoA family FMN-dependent monooxygenase [Streptomyces sp. NPDC049813]|uniref:NtaA/DmoA family FMN-dependent monooxygenase n=1 Tax=Streptomyces sp. NPDC049813 TaxID=3365597 RepID=UPI0037A2D4CA